MDPNFLTRARAVEGRKISSNKVWNQHCLSCWLCQLSSELFVFFLQRALNCLVFELNITNVFL